MAIPPHPTLYHTSEDVAWARVNVQRFEWAKDYFQTVKTEADKWAAMSDEEPELKDAIANIVPFPKATTVTWLQSGYFRGKLIKNERTGKTSTIIDVEKEQRTIRVEDPSFFSPEDNLVIYDIQPGDELFISVVVHY